MVTPGCQDILESLPDDVLKVQCLCIHEIAIGGN
jgi:hypothetical protein